MNVEAQYAPARGSTLAVKNKLTQSLAVRACQTDPPDGSFSEGSASSHCTSCDSCHGESWSKKGVTERRVLPPFTFFPLQGDKRTVLKDTSSFWLGIGRVLTHSDRIAARTCCSTRIPLPARETTLQAIHEPRDVTEGECNTPPACARLMPMTRDCWTPYHTNAREKKNRSTNHARSTWKSAKNELTRFLVRREREFHAPLPAWTRAVHCAKCFDGHVHLWPSSD